MGEQGWWILSGNTKGDKRGEWTYTRGRGKSVIDYILRNDRESREKREWNQIISQ